MGFTVKYNHLGAVAKELPRRIDDEVDHAAEAMARELKGTLWVDTGLVRRVTVEKPRGKNHAEVWIGYNRGRGFYSRFQEWGTIYQHARPIVGPTAHRYEEPLRREMGQAIREACDAK